jgi:hypothetical protein
VRLLTWNCCRGRLAVKGPPVQALSPDLVVLQECARPQAGETGWLWFGDNPRQGIGVWAAPGYRLRPLPPRPGVPRYTVPLKVTRPRPFLLFAVWAHKDPAYPYVRAVIRAVEIYRDLIASQPTVILGDFNSNAQWNRAREDARDHAYLVRLLTELGLVSTYHRFHGEEHGAESRPTLYLLRSETRPYHVDYCFIPKAWGKRLTEVRVGSYADWRHLSDHRPLVVDILK